MRSLSSALPQNVCKDRVEVDPLPNRPGAQALRDLTRQVKRERQLHVAGDDGRLGPATDVVLGSVLGDKAPPAGLRCGRRWKWQLLGIFTRRAAPVMAAYRRPSTRTTVKTRPRATTRVTTVITSAGQSRQNGGSGVLMFSRPTPQVIRPYDPPYSRGSQYVDRDSIGSAYAFQQRFSA